VSSIFSEINAPIGLRTLPLSYSEYAQACFDLFSDEQTLVFVDTNILALPFRFHSRAREGFFSLLQIASSQKRLVVPAWASNEFFHGAFKANGSAHGFSSTVKKQLGSAPTADSVRKILSRALSDEELDNYSNSNGVSRDDVIDDLARTIDKWNKDIDRLGKDLDAEFIHGQLLDALKGCFLSLDFTEHCALVERHADRRRANRIPPGLTDGKKGDADRRGVSAGNVDGDLALWLEILQAARDIATGVLSTRDGDPEYNHVIVLCEERKEDFLYTPANRQREEPERTHQPKPTKNDTPPIKVPDPRLVSEFERAVGHRSLAFVTMEELARGSLGAKPDRRIRQFIEALTQQKDTEAGSGESGATEDRNTLVVEETIRVSDAVVVSDAPAAATLAIPEGAMSAEKDFIEGLPEGSEKDTITRINTHNWYIQNPAILELRTERFPCDLGAAFVLGRAVYQAADGSAWRASEFLRGLDGWVSDPNEYDQAFVAGAAYEMLFTGHGVLREMPKSGAMDIVLDLLNAPRWRPAWECIHAQLRKAGRIVLATPGEAVPNIRLELRHEEADGKRTVTDVLLRIGEGPQVSLKATVIDDPLKIYSASVSRLVDDVAEFLLVRNEAVTEEKSPPVDDDATLVFPPELVLSLAPVAKLVRKEA
jgi:hypothetical protein